MFSTLVTNAAASVLLTVSPTPLADVYVDQSASNCTTGTGASTDPVCSIGAAIALASPGDTLRIAAGTYFENLVLNFDLELVGTSGATVTTINGGANGSVVTIPMAVTVTIDGLTLTNGRADYGGGVKVEGNVTIRNSIITKNRAVGTQGAGGSEWGGAGIGSINSGGGLPVAPVPQIVIENSTISSNIANFAGSDAPLSGGGMYVRFGEVEILGSTISGNWCRGAGGGVLLTAGRIDMTNSTISGNRSNRSGGGGLYVNPQMLSVFNQITVTDNHAPLGYGGGIQGGALVMLGNSIVAGNTAVFDSPQYNEMYHCMTSLGHNLIGNANSLYCSGFVDGVQGDQVGTLAAPLDPLLGPLMNHGGSTATHSPLFNSPALGSADPASSEATDQRGVLRPLGSGPDIGAVEYDDILESLCNGDGGDQLGCTDCPCGNNATPGTIGGCTNSSASSARLSVEGSPSVSLPAMSSSDLRLSLSGAPPAALAILNSGEALAPASSVHPCFGLESGTQAAVFDGLRCAVQNSRRHGGRPADANGNVGDTNNPWGGEAAPALGLAQAFGGFLAGEVSYFQVIYRDDPLAICTRGLNTSQAIKVTFAP